MRAMDVRIGFWMGVKLTFLGLYFNHFLPGSVGGDFIRAWYVAQNTHKRMASVVSVLADRVLALFGTLIMAGVGFWLAGNAEMLKRQSSSELFLGISRYKTPITIGFMIAAGLCFSFFLLPNCQKNLNSIFIKLLQHGRNGFQQMIDVAVVFVKKPLLLPAIMILTFFLQSMVVLSLWFLGREMNIPAEWTIFFVVFPLAWVAGVIPVSIAGIGVVEGGIIYLLVHFGGASYESATALALSQRAVWVVASLPGLAIYLFGEHLPKGLAE